MAAPGPSDITFTARLGKVRPGDTWTCVRPPESGQIFKTRGLARSSAPSTVMTSRSIRRSD